MIWEKFRSASHKDANFFLFEKKIRSIAKKDTDLFLYWEKVRSTSNKDVDLFYFKKNSDLHLRKIQICFIWRKRVDYMQIFKIKKQIIPTINKLRTCFYKPNYEYLKQLNTHHYDKKSIKIKGFRKQPLAWTLFYLRGCFRVQRNLFNYLWNLKTLASTENRRGE